VIASQVLTIEIGVTWELRGDASIRGCNIPIVLHSAKFRRFVCPFRSSIDSALTTGPQPHGVSHTVGLMSLQYQLTFKALGEIMILRRAKVDGTIWYGHRSSKGV